MAYMAKPRLLSLILNSELFTNKHIISFSYEEELKANPEFDANSYPDTSPLARTYKVEFEIAQPAIEPLPAWVNQQRVQVAMLFDDGMLMGVSHLARISYNVEATEDGMFRNISGYLELEGSLMART